MSKENLWAYRWEVGNHIEGHDGERSTLYIVARTGKRAGDTSAVTGLLTWAYERDKDFHKKIELIRVISQRVCDDHNASLEPPK